MSFPVVSHRMPTLLVTGASRGIGLELCRQYAVIGWSVIATARDPADAAGLQALAKEHRNVRLEALDVTDGPGVDRLAAKLAGTPIDLLINNAGISGGVTKLGELDYAVFEKVMATNYIGAVKMTEAFLEHVAKSELKRIVCISSTMGSIARTVGGVYAYRASKAAMNMAMRSIARDLAPRGIYVGIISPGLVDTDFTRTQDTPKISVQESVAGLMRMIETLDAKTSGEFLRYSGETVPW